MIVLVVFLALGYVALLAFAVAMCRAARMGDQMCGREPRDTKPRRAERGTTWPTGDSPSRPPTTTTTRYVEGHRVYEVRG